MHVLAHRAQVTVATAVDDQCLMAAGSGRHWLTLRANKLRKRLPVMKINDATHNATSIARRCVAVGREIPMPVARAT